MPPSPTSRISAALITLVAVAGVILQYVVLAESLAPEGKGPLATLWRFLGYFTILTNIWVAALMLAQAAGRAVAPRWMTASTLAIVLVGIVYHLLLSGLHDPAGLDWLANFLVHTAVPLLTPLFWLAFVDRTRLTMADIPAFVAFPLAYTVYAIARGAADGWYPYFFMDVGKLGPARVALNVAAMGLVFALAGVGAVALGRIGRAREGA